MQGGFNFLSLKEAEKLKTLIKSVQFVNHLKLVFHKLLAGVRNTGIAQKKEN